MKGGTLLLPIAGCFVLCAFPVFAQTPVLKAVLNNASFAYTGLPNSNIAQGSIFVLFGTNLGTTGPTAKFPLSTTLNGASITVAVNGTTVAAWPLYTTSGQVGAVLPSTTPAGSGTVTLTYNGQTSTPLPIQVVTSSFGTFSINQQGSGPGIITDAYYQIITVAAPAKPGQTLIIWGTGLGPVPAEVNEAEGAVPQDLTNIAVQVIVGGQTAHISYRGRSGCCAGVDQIVFDVPQNVQGCNVSVMVQIDDVVSNATTMAVANNGKCSDPNSLSSADLSKLLNNGKIGFVLLDRVSLQTTLPFFGTSIPTTTVDIGSASFFSIEAPELLSSPLPIQTASFGSCTVTTFSGIQSGTAISNIPFQGLDAGAAISVAGSAGTKQMTASQTLKGSYAGQLGGGTGSNAQPLFLNAGDYTIANGTGGADIVAFSVKVTVPPALTWTNANQIATVNRGADQSITWSGGDPNSFVNITGTSLTAAEPIVGATFSCISPVSAGSFTIPSAVLLSLPPSGTLSLPPSGALVGIAAGGTLAVGSTTLPQALSIPGVDVAYGYAGSSSGKTVTYQ